MSLIFLIPQNVFSGTITLAYLQYFSFLKINLSLLLPFQVTAIPFRIADRSVEPPTKSIAIMRPMQLLLEKRSFSFFLAFAVLP